MMNEDLLKTMNKEREPRRFPVRVGEAVHYLDIDQPLTVKELAFYLNKSRGYISAMKKAGFKMPVDPVARVGVATYRQALAWLEAHPKFTWNSVYKRRNPKRQKVADKNR